MLITLPHKVGLSLTVASHAHHELRWSAVHGDAEDQPGQAHRRPFHFENSFHIPLPVQFSEAPVDQSGWLA
jgi:hypothetical protein